MKNAKLYLLIGFTGVIAILDALVAASIFTASTVNLFVIGISFANSTPESTILNVPVTTFNGQVNSENVVNLTTLQVSLAAIYLSQDQLC